MERRTVYAIVAIAIVAIVVLAVVAVELNRPPSKVTLTESGSTLLYPVFNSWKANYTNATITTVASGSGAGISAAIAGTYMIGASDAFISPSLASANPYVMNIPILISYQYIAYNVPGLPPHLNLSADIIAGIYMGQITNWNSTLIQQANPGISFPNHTIIPVHRSDGSGDTFMFTSFLSKGNSTWDQAVGTGTNPSWPSVAASIAGTGNAGVISQMQTTDYTIGYIAATYESQVSSSGFGLAYLENQNGQYVAPTVANVSTAAAQYLPYIPANGTIALQYAPGNNSYPIADMEYVIVKQNQTSTAIADALQEFLNWIVDPNGGSASNYLVPYNLVALPSSVVNGVTKPLIDKIHG